MSVTEVKLKRLDDLEAEEVLLEGGESFLGKYYIFLTISPDKKGETLSETLYNTMIYFRSRTSAAD